MSDLLEVAKEILMNLQAAHFAFTVESQGTKWDIYHTRRKHVLVTIAVAMAEDKEHVGVGLLVRGHLKHDACKKALDEAPKE